MGWGYEFCHSPLRIVEVHGSMQIEPFSSGLLPQYEHASKCEAIHIKMCFYLHAHFHANQSHFHVKRFAGRVVLKPRQMNELGNGLLPVTIWFCHWYSLRP